MKELDVTTMKNIEGGADPILITGIVTMVIAFVSGILNGIANPKNVIRKKEEYERIKYK